MRKRDSETLTIEEVAVRIRRSAKTVQRLIRTGALEAVQVKIGGSRRVGVGVTPEALARFEAASYSLIESDDVWNILMSDDDEHANSERRMRPKTKPQYELIEVDAVSASCPNCGAAIKRKFELRATQGVDVLEMFNTIGSKLDMSECVLIDAWIHRAQGDVYDENLNVASTRQEATDDSARRVVAFWCHTRARRDTNQELYIVMPCEIVPRETVSQ